jgi:hypothetical protein
MWCPLSTAGPVNAKHIGTRTDVDARQTLIITTLDKGVQDTQQTSPAHRGTVNLGYKDLRYKNTRL